MPFPFCCNISGERGATSQCPKSAAYSTLRNREIRLVRLSPPTSSSSKDDGSRPSQTPEFSRPPLCLSFQVVSLEQTQLPDFVALSYAWGNAKDHFNIQVSGHPVPITRNLYDILQCLSLHEGSNLLWIDALCINQNDNEERSRQVLLMRDVYSMATSVRVFLSSVSEPFNLGMSFLEQAALLPEMHYSPDRSQCIKIDGLGIDSEVLRESFIAFFAVPWWTRVWPVQEYVLAKKVSFQCGQRLLEGSQIQAAFKSLVHHERTCCWATERSIDGYGRGYLHIPSKTNSPLTIFHATLRLDNLQNMLDPEAYSVHNILDAMATFRIRDCSDPRDRVFGMLGLRFRDETLRNEIKVDYQIPVGHLYESVTIKLIESSQSLDVLSDVLQDSFIQEPMHRLPSWVVDWTAKMDATSHLMYLERRKLLNQFHASRKTMPVWKHMAHGQILTKAMIISRIAETAVGYPRYNDSLSGRMVLKQWRLLASLPEDTVEYYYSVNERYKYSQQEWEFRTLLCGFITSHSWDNDDASRVYEIWAKWFSNDTAESFSVGTRNEAREFDNLVRYTSFGRNIFVAEDGRVGFGPETMKVGDVLAILPGGKVPYILRVDDRPGEAEGTPKYTFLGDATVQGIMFGEAMELVGESHQMGDIVLI